MKEKAKYRKVVNGAGRMLIASRTAIGAFIGILIGIGLSAIAKASLGAAVALTRTGQIYGWCAWSLGEAAKATVGLAVIFGCVGFVTGALTVILCGYFDMVPRDEDDE